MRYVGFAAFTLLVSTTAASAADIGAACIENGGRTPAQCACFAEMAATSLTLDDQAYVVMMMPGPAATRAALRDMAGDAEAFMQRYVAFSAAVELQCPS